MGLLFVANQVRGDLEFLGINFLRPTSEDPGIDELKILQEKLQLIHFQRGSRVRQGGHGEKAKLRMVRRAPGTGAAAMGLDALNDAPVVRDFGKDVRKIARKGAAHARRAPDFSVNRGERPVLARPNFDRGVSAGPVTGNHEFQIAVKHELDGPARLFAQRGANGAPFIDAELRAETPAHVLAIDVDFVLRNLRRLSQTPIGITRDILGRRPYVKLAIADFRHLPVRFQTAMRDYRDTVTAIHHYLGFG